MPLQKPPPKSRRVADQKVRADKQIKNQRRKTLQTISELAPHHATTQGSTGSSSWSRNDVITHDSPGNLGLKHSRNSRRRSLPVQGLASQRDCTGFSERSISSSGVSTLQRSGTALNNQQGSSRNNPRRRSMPTSFETRGRSLSPVAEGELSRQPIPDDLLGSAPSRSRSGRQQSDGPSRGTDQQGGGWNARRKRDLIRREQALMEANARRTKEHLSLAIGSSAALPTVSPLPASRDDLIAQQSRYYSQLPSLSQPAGANSVRRNSRGRNGRQVNGTIIDGRLFLDMDPGNAGSSPQTSGLRRSVSATSDRHWTSHREPANRTAVTAIRSVSSTSLLGSALAERQLVEPRSSSSLQTSSNSTRSSSTKSSVSSSTTKPTQRSSSFTYTRLVDHPLRQNPVTRTMGSNDCGPALTQANLETSLPPPLSHAFLGSQLVTQTTYAHSVPASPKSVASRQRPRSGSASQSRASSVHVQKVTDSNDIIYRENPDKRGPATPDSRNGSRRYSREETERQVAREKIKERVRRANELEEKKERELVEEEQKRKKAKSRGFICGLFGKA
ncbi:uncharacterized protein CC84DRAFT_1174969 [Paraphaeosphaeria sporulosa]|uniref:Uncharacterized protein n=1 Tax=Paraphaeosphaeria sporulosa TaxID=1460663 RepID=A0A177CJE9_9PLEO|nr:uncharacterized protein CC84DRAFT_1174969 [Paraphaeosphaeria sporulosa]OAG07102.1 hypothetical protein CC84DRAFT_1174969 [Paraphaeosphaeria sporulosa]